MALQRDTKYPGRFTTATTAHPQGPFKNRTSSTSQDGSYLEKDWLNDWDGFFGSLLSKAGLTPDGNVDAVGASQYFNALQDLVARGDYVIAGGTANAITLTHTTPLTSYKDGQVFRFKASATNTGATTINVDGLGAVTLYGAAGVACQGGETAANGYVVAVYSSTLSACVLIGCTGGNLQVVKASKSNHAVNFGQASGFTYRGQFHNLSVSAGGSDYTASATAETLVVTDSSYNCIGLRNVSISVNGANSGANGLDTGTIAAVNWYYLHVIYNPTTAVVAGLLSLSATTPTLPSGYTHFAAVQPLYIAAATTAFLGLSSTDGITEYTARQQVVSAGAATTTTAVSLAATVPPSAYPTVMPGVTTSNSTSSRVLLFEDSAGIHVVGSAQSNGVNTIQTQQTATRKTQTIYYTVYSATYTCSVWVNGFKWIP